MYKISGKWVSKHRKPSTPQLSIPGLVCAVPAEVPGGSLEGGPRRESSRVPLPHPSFCGGPVTIPTSEMRK